MVTDNHINRFKMFQQTLTIKRHRSAVFLQGEFAWACQWLSALTARNWQAVDLIFSSQLALTNVVTDKTYRHHLGTENSSLFFADESFNVDAFAALVGTLTAGGICFIWLPTGADKSSVFIQRLLTLLDANEGIVRVVQGLEKGWFDGKGGALAHEHASIALPTSGQQSAITGIKKVALGSSRKPLVITADRGRGKSSALALAAAQLLKESDKPYRIIVTAPHRMAVNVFFQQLTQAIPEGKLSGDNFKWGAHQVDFFPVDECLVYGEGGHLCLVDEAAGIPVYLLEQIIERYHRVVFSSTIHGYEGAGKGFTTKFIPMLQKHSKRVSTCHLKQPIRWHDNDPLENFVFKTCLLNAEFNEQALHQLDDTQLANVQYKRYIGAEIVNQEAILAQAFAILVTAHYQTKPSDLKLLLDDPQITLHILSHQQQPVAVALTIEEEISDPELQAAIVSGERRIKGQLIPQVICQQLLQPSGLGFRYLRIMRIAVPPALQGKGLGAKLLAKIQHNAEQQGVDFVGTSFALSTQVLIFWQQRQFQAVKLGFVRDASSGEHSLLMLKGLNQEAQDFAQKLTAEFYQELIPWLRDEFNHLDYTLVAHLCSGGSADLFTEISPREREKIIAFIGNKNFYSIAKSALVKLLCKQLVKDKENIHVYLPLIAKCFMAHNDKDVVQHFGFTGKKALYQALQQIVVKHLSIR